MIKAVLFDVDGLITTKPAELFSERLSKSRNIPLEAITEFFEKDFRKTSFGKADLKELLVPYLEKWGWTEPVEEFLHYWYESGGEIDTEVMEIVEKIRQKAPCYIASRKEKYRKAYIWEELDLKNHFDGIFCTCDIGCDKSEPGYFEHVLKELSLKPEEVLFFDDSQKNVDYAHSIGVKAYFYEGIHTLKEATSDML